MKKAYLYVIIALAIIGYIIGVIAFQLNQKTKDKTAKTYLNIKLRKVDGGTFTLSDYLGRVIVLEFIWTKCPHCENFLPTFRKFYEEYSGAGVVFISVSPVDSMRELKEYAKTRNIQWILALDEGGKLAKILKVKGTPTTIIINRKGEIHKIIAGETNLKELKNAIRGLI